MTTVGLDISEGGKLEAIAVARTEQRKDERGKQRTHYKVWILERLSGKPDDEAVKRVAEIVDEAMRQDRSKYKPTLYGNVTATGKPALGALSGRGVRAEMKPVYLTPGDGQPVQENREVRLHTGWLVCRLQELLQEGWLDLPDTAEAKELMQELLDWRPGAVLESLTTAVGLAVWRIPMEVRVRKVGERTEGLRMRRGMGEFLDRAS